MRKTRKLDFVTSVDPDQKLAQPIRLLLSYVGEEFVEVQYEMGEGPEFNEEEWFSQKFKLDMEFPNIPYYMSGDVKISQSNAILMYLGRKYNMVGTTEDERIMLDIILNHAMDVRVMVDDATYSPKYEELKADLFQKLSTVQLPMLEKRLQKVGTGWFIGDKLTIVDFPLYEIMDNLRVMQPGCLEHFPSITEFMDKFEAVPAIKTYMQSSKFMKSPINNKIAAFRG